MKDEDYKGMMIHVYLIKNICIYIHITINLCLTNIFHNQFHQIVLRSLGLFNSDPPFFRHDKC